MKRFLKIIKRLQPYKKWLGLSIFFNVLMAIFTIAGIPLFIPFFEILFSDKKATVITENGSGIKEDITNLLSGVLSETDPDTALNYIIFLIIFIFLLKNVSRYLAHFFIAPVRNGFIRDLRKELFDHLISLPIQFFKKNKKGDLLARMSMDIQETENSILNILETLIKSPLLILGSLIFMFYVSYELTLLVLLMIPFTILIIGGLSRTLKRQSGVAQEKLGDLMAILDEAVTGNKIIKSFNANQLLKNKFAKTNNSHKHLLTRILWRKDLGSPLAEILAVMVIAGLMYYAARLVFIDKLSPDTFFAFIYAFFIIIEPAKSFSAAFYSYRTGVADLERLVKLLNIQNPVELNPNGISISDLKEKIEFHGVSYQYPDGASPVLKNISLEIKKGQKIAIVGASGAGKTTLVDLLPRFMDYNEGKILIDGISIKELNLQDLRSIIGIVTQDSILFNDTIGQNISFGMQAKSLEQIKGAAKIANIDSFVDELPLTYNSLVGDQGNKLSGGQKQRIAIARAVLKNAPILILDEATSSLDSASEKKVQQALKILMKDKTALIIAHRLSTVQEADKIIVLQDGKIIEAGNHEELMHKNGEYFKFVQLQTLKKDWTE